MTLTELRYVVALARERHFGRAATACFVSQPTLSVAVKKLEEELGVLIFERYQHEVAITPVGERIIAQAERVLEQAAVIKTISAEGKDQLKGEFRLGIIYTVAPYLLPRLIPLLHERAPEMRLIIDEDFTANLAPRLRRGDLDAVIISTPFEVAAVNVEVLYEEPFVIALPHGHPLGRKQRITADEMIEETLLLLKTGNCFRDQVMAVCPACGGEAFSRDRIQKTLEGSSIETIRSMVAAGSGITVLPALSAREDGEVGRLLEYRPFAEPVPSREIAIAYRATFPRDKAIAVIRGAVADSGLPGVRLRNGVRSAAAT